MEYSPFETLSPTESDAVELTPEDMVEGGTTTEPGMVQRVTSLARQALSQVRSTTHRVRAGAPYAIVSCWTSRLEPGTTRPVAWARRSAPSPVTGRPPAPSHRTFHASDPASEADRANAAAFATAHTHACCLASLST